VPLPLPNLDMPRYRELVGDAHALIPRYAPAWTDHNESDPGITLVELLVWLVEQDVYRVNRIPERHRRKFLRLTGIVPDPPRAARAVLSLSAPADIRIPVGTRFDANGVPFTSTNWMRIAQTGLAAVQSWDGRSFEDLTDRWRGGLPVPAWGDDPAGFDGDDPPALLLGFDKPLPAHSLSLWLAVEGGDDGDEAQRIADEEKARRRDCERLRPQATCGEEAQEAALPAGKCRDECLRTVWELWEGGTWREVQASDATHGLLLDGVVRMLAPGDGDERQLGAVARPLRWLRCRAAGGAPDAPPRVTSIGVNAVVVSQRVPVSSRLSLTPGAQLPSPALTPGELARLALEFDAAGRVSRVKRTRRRAVPRVRVLDVDAKTLELTVAVAGSGLGVPELTLELREAPVADGAISVWSGEDGWDSRPDLDAALPRARAFVVDAQHGVLSFGDGERGLAPREGETLLAAYAVTRGAAGNVPSTAAWSAPGHPTVRVRAQGPARGGADAEELAHAAGRAAEALWAHERLLELAGAASTLDSLDRTAVTAAAAPQRAATVLDFARLALTVPGTRVARARAWPEIDAGAPGLRAPGTVSVVVMGSLPAARPEPSRCLLDRVERYLRRRKTLGTRLVVTGPDYVEVRASATLAILPGADSAAVTGRAAGALAGFIEPRKWQFGRDVFRAEVLALLDGVDGVDAVTSLELSADGGEPSCGNVCIGPTQLPVSGKHRVEVAA
jgi:predicted phage baseplate assembly protein